MGKIKISQLPEVTSLASTDLLTAVANSTSSKVTVQSLSNSLTVVSSSISSSYAATASHATIFTLVPTDPLPTSSATFTVFSGSLMSSGSGTNLKPYFWNGNSWTALY